MSWIRHNRQLFDWQILPTYVPSAYVLDTTSLYGHLKGIDLLLASLHAYTQSLAAVAQSGQYADLLGAPDPADYYTALQVDGKLGEILVNNALPIQGGTVHGALTLQKSGTYIRVSGAGTALANGVYEHDGEEFTGAPSSPKPVYRQADAPHLSIKYLSYPSTPFVAWYISNEQAQQNYYVAPGNVPTPDYATGWKIWSGAEPLPTVEPLAAELAPHRIEANEVRTGTRFYFAAGDYLHGDGTNLFYTTADGQTTTQLTANGGP